MFYHLNSPQKVKPGLSLAMRDNTAVKEAFLAMYFYPRWNQRIHWFSHVASRKKLIVPLSSNGKAKLKANCEWPVNRKVDHKHQISIFVETVNETIPLWNCAKMSDNRLNCTGNQFAPQTHNDRDRTIVRERARERDWVRVYEARPHCQQLNTCTSKLCDFY